MINDPAHIPVIIGVGQINDRPDLDQIGLDAIGLMAAAARAADQDAGGGLLSRCDWLAIVPQISFRELDPVTLLPAALGITPAHVRQAQMASGDTPILYLNEAANAVASGEAQVCLIVGGEALRTASRQRQLSGPGAGLFRAHLTAPELCIRYGVLNPAEIYALYENSSRADWGQTLAEGQAETGRMWSQLSDVAASAEGAWIKSPKSPEQIVEPTADNRPIAFPFTKYMVANSSVNQGAAYIVTSLAIARDAGVPENRLVYIWAGAAAHDQVDPLARISWNTPEVMRVSIKRALSINGLTTADLDHVELYSCFPCVPKMARRILGWPADRPITVHGGLTFGGGPIGNYMTHAVAAMVDALRRGGRNGLLFANGGHCTHNHSIVISRDPPREGLLPQNYSFQSEADSARGALPALDDSYQGVVTVETYTIVYDRMGKVDYGIVLSRAPDGSRVIAKVAGEDARAISVLTDGVAEPVGINGITTKVGDTLFWQPIPTTDKGNT